MNTDQPTGTSKNIIDRRASHGIAAVVGVVVGVLVHVAVTPARAPDDDLVGITSVALDRAQSFWRAQDAGYRDARVVLISRPESTPCGTADQSSGPFYCPADEKIYLDLSFLRSISGDLARAYVVAHEVGHHVQKQRTELGQPSVNLELEADCYAGQWMRDEQSRGHLAEGDLATAVAEAMAVGDDRICPECSTEEWTHGSSAQRAAALLRGSRGESCQ